MVHHTPHLGARLEAEHHHVHHGAQHEQQREHVQRHHASATTAFLRAVSFMPAPPHPPAPHGPAPRSRAPASPGSTVHVNAVAAGHQRRAVRKSSSAMRSMPPAKRLFPDNGRGIPQAAGVLCEFHLLAAHGQCDGRHRGQRNMPRRRAPAQPPAQATRQHVVLQQPQPCPSAHWPCPQSAPHSWCAGWSYTSAGVPSCSNRPSRITAMRSDMFRASS